MKKDNRLFVAPFLFFAMLLVFSCFALLNCTNQTGNQEPSFEIEYEKFELDNGLDVIFHIDRSDPVVAVTLMAHVGSAREKTDRTGFAHLFEHLLFLESENLGKGGLDKLSARIGGAGANGATNRDVTVYLQTVPKDALEKMLWAEADKLGWFVNTVTEPVLAKEKQVVKNEKRQVVDNRPYGHTSYVIGKNLYPNDHPYNWQVIGSLKDLQNATLDDVKEFYNRWYVTNNVTLVVSGDFDTRQAKDWVHRYFGEIPRGEDVTPIHKRPGQIPNSLRLYHEDNFAKLPELTLTWSGAPIFHPDSYPLEILTRYLSRGKSAPFNRILVEKTKLTSQVNMNQYNSELAGQIGLSVRAFNGIPLDTVLAQIEEGFKLFEKEGISENDLRRIKSLQEVQFYNQFSSVLQKGYMLAYYDLLTGDPGFALRDLKGLQSVTAKDVMRVYEQYIRDENYVSTSFVPKGGRELVLSGSIAAQVVEERIVQDAEESFDASASVDYTKTPSKIDRSVEPPFGDTPTIAVPDIWEFNLDNGLKVFGIESNEVPLVYFRINIEGGQLFDNLEKAGVANVAAGILTKGTKNKTPEEFENALQLLGASVNMRANREQMRISGSTLAKNFEATIKLLEEALLEPRWDTLEFDLIKKSTLNRIRQQSANPNTIARNQFNELMYGEGDIRSKNILGSLSSVEGITMDDVKAFYSKYVSPSIASMHAVGAIDEGSVRNALKSLEANWHSKDFTIQKFNIPDCPEQSRIYFYDIPDAKQSRFLFGSPALLANDENYYPSTVMNYILGGGGFASQLMQVLREEKGYTYGIGSEFNGSKTIGEFTIATSVRTNITLEAAQLIKEIVANYGENYNESDLLTTKSSLIKGNARAFETPFAKLNMLTNISKYGWEYDYVKEREKIVEDMTVERIKSLTNEYLYPDKMIYVIVGDAKTQLNRLEHLGFGKPVLLNE